MKTITIAGLTVTLLLTGCQATREQTGQALGGLLGGAGGYGLARTLGGKAPARVISTVTGVAIGAWLGGQIGQHLDERERRAAQHATVVVLNHPIPATPRPPGAPGLQPVPQAPRRTWSSPHNPGVRGQSQLVAAGIDRNGRDCKKIREAAVIHGKEVFQEAIYCWDAEKGGWIGEV